MDLLKLAAEHLLLLRRWNTARSWLQTKGLKFNQFSQAWAGEHDGELVMSCGIRAPNDYLILEEHTQPPYCGQGHLLTSLSYMIKYKTINIPILAIL